MPQGLEPTGDEIASSVLQTFSELPTKRKPLNRTDGSREWVPLSGIVLAKAGKSLTCVSLGYINSAHSSATLVDNLSTGMKCLPASKIPQAQGVVLHDCHAEIVTIRAFNRFLIHECAALAQAEPVISPWLRTRNLDEISNSSPQPFALQEHVSIYFYSSEAPCGDASMELTMLAQDDATPWEVPSSVTEQVNLGPIRPVLKGRGYFSQLGVVRRKPARPDAPLSLSKSCTDKLALSQCTSILSSTVSLLVSPKGVYIKTLVLPSSQHIPAATQRAFSPLGRMAPITSDLTQNWQGGFSFQPFNIETTSLHFEWSRRSGNKEQKMLPSNISAVFTPHFQENLIGGVLQGRKQFDPRGASATCRKSMWHAIAEVSVALDVPWLVKVTSAASYKQLKACDMLKPRKEVKYDVCEAALKGWATNEGDDNFGVDR